MSGKTQLVLGSMACVWTIGVIIRAYLRRSYLPPPPPNRRLWGHSLLPHNASLTVAQWIDEYGPLITIRSGLRTIVIIGRYKAAVDIMEKQRKVVAGRPRIVAAELVTRGLGIILLQVDDRFRRLRRALHSHLQPKSAHAYQPMQMSQAKFVILSILDDPDNFQNHVTTFAATTSMKVAYGKTTPTSATDPEIIESRQLTRRFRVILRHGHYLMELIPWLKYLPGYALELKDHSERTRRLYTDQLNRVKLQMQSNEDIGPSFAKHILENGHLYVLTEIEMAYLAGGLFGAATETTAVAICTVLMAAAHFPDEQVRVQDELDEVIGRKRGNSGFFASGFFASQLCRLNYFAKAPTFADKSSLPRLEAFISEAMRWRPLIHPRGASLNYSRCDLGECSLNDLLSAENSDILWQENYCIPAGTTVTGNIWAISRDPEVYPEPDAFKPQRWVNDQGRLRDDLAFFVYGFGRRICPGQHIANRSIFINSLLILWAFELSLDPMKPQDDMGFMNTTNPNVPLAIKFKPRVPEVELRCMMQSYPEAG
ncbi:hypothetical protein CY34DRAFT_10981 [Suillus luteus UH-Slu-Lm8-n1]|uniref:Cytochrome P450 n=1 Tax=Suillus luteus UH-Slu-Lm8-n1 TaxID=930992 RepID=A0A0D0ASA7_9AGAM|nr:hypothetical protein CY34DRAFT_10981 [Suillus luteus UH-Slu-Lm8-n1]